MVEVVRATPKREPLALVDLKVLRELVSYAGPVLMGLVVLLSLSFTLQRATILRDWSANYADTADFVVTACAPVEEFSGHQWWCQGRFEGPGAEDGSTLITSREAASSHRPYVGERLEVFHHVDGPATVYPVQFRLNELTRLYLSLLPRILVLLGAVIWLAGWALTRNHNAEDLVSRDAMRLPQRFAWRSRGLAWISVGVGVLVLNYFLTTRLLGSLAIF